MEKMSNTLIEERRQRAKKRVKAIKGFYGHLWTYLIVNVIMVFVYIWVTQDLLPDVTHPNFYNWLEMNFIMMPILWGIVLVFQGLYVYRRKLGFLKRWEERQLQKILQKEEQHAQHYSNPEEGSDKH